MQEEISQPKVLIIGGGIANFTDIAATFYGIIDALRDQAAALIKHRVSIWVRRGGPNCQVRERAACVLPPPGLPLLSSLSPVSLHTHTLTHSLTHSLAPALLHLWL